MKKNKYFIEEVQGVYNIYEYWGKTKWISATYKNIHKANKELNYLNERY